MARPVYSVRLWSLPQQQSQGPYAGPTVPTGFTWVVRDIRMLNTGQINALHVATLNVGTTSGVLIASSPAFASIAGQVYHWQGRGVLEAGDQLQASTTTFGWQVVVDGYQLTAT